MRSPTGQQAQFQGLGGGAYPSCLRVNSTPWTGRQSFTGQRRDTQDKHSRSLFRVTNKLNMHFWGEPARARARAHEIRC